MGSPSPLSASLIPSVAASKPASRGQFETGQPRRPGQRLISTSTTRVTASFAELIAVRQVRRPTREVGTSRL